MIYRKERETTEYILKQIDFYGWIWYHNCATQFNTENHRECVFTLVKTHSPLCVPYGFRRIASQQWSYAFFSVQLHLGLSAKDGLTIYDDVPAYIDGTICASLYDGNTKVASALMVLPLNGISSRKVGIVGMGLSGAKENKTYTIKFTAHKLWLMEK